MDHDTSIGQVQARTYLDTRTYLDSRGRAEAATRATLETPAEHIPASLADNLAPGCRRRSTRTCAASPPLRTGRTPARA